MARMDFLTMLKVKAGESAGKTAKNFDWDSITAPPMLSLLSMYDLKLLADIATDPRLNAKIQKKREYIDNILVPRGFSRLGSGTNRLVYKHLELQSIVLKTPISEVGIEDCSKEFYNQRYLAPYVSKCFEVSPFKGMTGLYERVEAITSKPQFLSIAEDVFDLLDNFIGKFVLADVGTNFFMNYGLRLNFGPVLLDYPLVFILDGNKLYCNMPDMLFPSIPCGGPIDYDAGYNFLYCKKCGKQYLASRLARENPDNIIITGRKRSKMKVKIMNEEGKVIKESLNVNSANNYIVEEEKSDKEELKVGRLKVTVNSELLEKKEENAVLIQPEQSSEEEQKSENEEISTNEVETIDIPSEIDESADSDENIESEEEEEKSIPVQEAVEEENTEELAPVMNIEIKSVKETTSAEKQHAPFPKSNMTMNMEEPIPVGVAPIGGTMNIEIKDERPVRVKIDKRSQENLMANY